MKGVASASESGSETCSPATEVTVHVPSSSGWAQQAESIMAIAAIADAEKIFFMSYGCFKVPGVMYSKK